MSTVFVAVGVISSLLVLHELGHFLMAMLVGIEILEFGVGFGPELVSYRGKHTRYVLRLVPFGAYVKPLGMDPGEGALKESAYWAKPVGQRALFVLGGPAVNMLLAVLVFSWAFGVFGRVEPTLQVNEVMQGLPAERAGVQPGDWVVAIDGLKLNAWDDLVSYVRARPGKALTLTCKRGDQVFELDMVAAVDPSSGVGIIGLVPQVQRVRFGLLGALIAGAKQTWDVTYALFHGLLLTLARKVKPDIVGPVGIGQIVAEASRAGAESLAFTVGALSASLGFSNLLPIPAIDGSRLLFLTLEWLLGRPIDPRKENMVHLVGFILLIAAGAVILVRDIERLGM
ncbi:MAG: M50 family metallopeptidase [Bacillota bacterium]